MTLPHAGWVAGVRWCPSNPHLLASADFEGAVQLWDIRATVPLHSLTPHQGKAMGVAWDGLGRIASGGSDGQLKYFDVALPEMK